jgi:DNA primase
MISSNTIEQVKSRMEVVEVVSEFVKLKRNGLDYKGFCPFHNEKTPSFSVNKAMGMYKCFGCGKSGDAIQFLKKRKPRLYSSYYLAGQKV